MTYAELTAFIDAQLADPSSLPAWWGDESGEAELNQTPVPFVVRRNGEVQMIPNPK